MLRSALFLAKYYLYNLIRQKTLYKLTRVVRVNRRPILKSHIGSKGSDTFVVVGNGPSLDIKEIERLSLKNYTFIASNKIYLLFDKTDWRPDMYTIADPLVAYKHRNFDFSFTDKVLVPDSQLFMYSRNLRMSKLQTWTQKKFKDLRLEPDFFFPDPEKLIFDSGTVTIQNIQLAIWLGASNIYLIGCDHSYAERAHKVLASKSSDSLNNHFNPRYRVKGEIVNSACINQMNEGYDFLYALSKHLGINIVNLTVDSKLKSFPIKDYKYESTNT